MSRIYDITVSNHGIFAEFIGFFNNVAPNGWSLSFLPFTLKIGQCETLDTIFMMVDIALYTITHSASLYPIVGQTNSGNSKRY